jgi:hypothetical protein
MLSFCNRTPTFIKVKSKGTFSLQCQSPPEGRFLYVSYFIWTGTLADYKQKVKTAASCHTTYIIQKVKLLRDLLDYWFCTSSMVKKSAIYKSGFLNCSMSPAFSKADLSCLTVI